MASLRGTEKVDFTGVIVRRDPDGYGVVEFENRSNADRYGFFTQDVIHHPNVSKRCVKGSRVRGRAVRYGEGFRILRLIAD